MPCRAIHTALPGGNGRAFDWTLLRGYAGQAVDWFLSGGLTPENVGQAIRLTGASGVDVSSGVENAPGDKSFGQNSSFIAAARKAVNRLISLRRMTAWPRGRKRASRAVSTACLQKTSQIAKIHDPF